MENKSTKSVKIEFLVKSNNIWTNVLFYSFQTIVVLTIVTMALPIVAGTSGYTQLANVAVIISLVLGIIEVVYLVAFIIGFIFYCINLGGLKKEGVSRGARNILGSNLAVCLLFIIVTIALIVLSFMNLQPSGGPAYSAYLAFLIIALFIPMISFILVKASRRAILVK